MRFVRMTADGFAEFVIDDEVEEKGESLLSLQEEGAWETFQAQGQKEKNVS